MAATSGSTAFNLDLTELVEEAFERAGSELRTGYDLRTARRSLNIMFADWANRGINMWTIEPGTITLVPGQNTYPLPEDTVDLLEHVIRTGAGSIATQADLTITRISVSTYATIPNKLTQARPIQLWVQRYSGPSSVVALTLDSDIGPTDTTIVLKSPIGSPTAQYSLPASGFIRVDNETINYGSVSGDTLYNCFRGQGDTTAAPHTAGSVVRWRQTPAITVWPTPDASQTYTLAYWRLRRMQDAGDGVNVMDVPFRFVPCMVAGLSYYLAGKIPSGFERLPMLKQQYDEAWQLAADEDREKASVRFVPRQMFIN